MSKHINDGESHIANEIIREMDDSGDVTCGDADQAGYLYLFRTRRPDLKKRYIRTPILDVELMQEVREFAAE
jgi:hypothetical protein